MKELIKIPIAETGRRGVSQLKRIVRCIKMADEPSIELINDKWQNILPEYESNRFDLAIVDPPYGIDATQEIGFGDTTTGRVGRPQKWGNKNWDTERPTKEYFVELFRVSKNQVIFGGNYFADLLPPSRCWLVWDKQRGRNQADAELCWTSFNTSVRVFDFHCSNLQGFRNPTRFHPTEKPVSFYKWVITKFAKDRDTILDTHLGSGSSAIAAWQKKHDFVGIECDTDYFNDMLHRFNMNTNREYALEAWQKQSEQAGQQTIFSE